MKNIIQKKRFRFNCEAEGLSCRTAIFDCALEVTLGYNEKQQLDVALTVEESETKVDFELQKIHMSPSRFEGKCDIKAEFNYFCDCMYGLFGEQDDHLVDFSFTILGSPENLEVRLDKDSSWHFVEMSEVN